MATKILVISPDNSDNTSLVNIVQRLGHDVAEAPAGLSLAEALAGLAEDGLGLVIINSDSPDLGQVTAWAGEVQVRGFPVLLALAGLDHQPLAQSRSICHRLQKPLVEDQVELAIQAALFEVDTARSYRQAEARLARIDQEAFRLFRRLNTTKDITDAGWRCTDSRRLAQESLGLILEFSGSPWGVILERGGVEVVPGPFNCFQVGAAGPAPAQGWFEETFWNGLWAGQARTGVVGQAWPRENLAVGFLMGVPLVRDGLVRGVLILGRSESAYTPQELEDASVLASTFSRVLAHKGVEEDLAENSEQYLDITKKMPLGVYKVDTGTGQFLSVNDVICEFTGYSRAELMNRPVTDLIHEESLPVFLARAERIRAGLPVPNKIDFKLKTREGGSLWVNAMPTFEYENGLPVTVSVIARDINDRKLAEEALRESEERYRHLFKHAPSGIYEIDFTTGRFVTVNDIMCEYLGYTREEFLNMVPTDILSEESRQVLAERLEKMLAGAPVTTNPEYLIRGKNGREFWTVLNSKFIQDQGRITGAMVIVHDITERRLAEEALRISEEKYRTLLASIQEGYFEVDLTGRFIFFSDWFCEVTGYTREEGLGMSFRDYMTPDFAESIEKMFNNIYRTGKPATKLDYEVRLKNGERRFHQLSASLSSDAHGRPVGFRGVVRDVTAQKLAEQELKAALQEKDVLLREIHHRVKNNMQVISSLLNLQEYQMVEDTGRAVLQDIRARITSMALIHEQLYRSTSLARIEMQPYTLEMAHSLLESYTPNRGGIGLQVDMAEVVLDVDQAVPCGLILNEIISNSLKHALSGTRDGRISITGRLTPDGMAQLVVSDNGPGLPPDLDWRHTRSMGLSLVVGLAEQQLGGHIDLDNTGGTAFTITFLIEPHSNKG